MTFLITQVRVSDVFRDAILQRRPSILAGPLPQKRERLRLVDRHFEVVRFGIVIYELFLWTAFAQNGQDIVPVSAVAPTLQACILDLRVQDGRDMDQRHVFHIYIEGCIKSN